MTVAKFVLRIKPALHKKVVNAAAKNGCSMNYLITKLIEDGLSLAARSDSAKLDKILEMLGEYDFGSD